MTSWLTELVTRRITEDARTRPWLAAIGGQVGGAFLWGTIGTEAVLKADGSVWLRQAPLGTNNFAPWREANPQQRLGLITDASRNWAEIRRLLPPKPPDA